MGCDIHSYVETLDPHTGEWSHREWRPIEDKWNRGPFDWRSYRVFGFLADVRNYSDVPAICPVRGLPDMLSEHVASEAQKWEGNGHSYSWLWVKELLDFDYEVEIEDRRVTKQIGPNAWDGSVTCEPGDGKRMKWRDFLDPLFFCHLDQLKAMGDPNHTRIVFWFDN